MPCTVNPTPCAYCNAPAGRVRRAHCLGAAAVPPNCTVAGCHQAALCLICDHQWMEPCREAGHSSSTGQQASAA